MEKVKGFCRFWKEKMSGNRKTLTPFRCSDVISIHPQRCSNWKTTQTAIFLFNLALLIGVSLLTWDPRNFSSLAAVQATVALLIQGTVSQQHLIWKAGCSTKLMNKKIGRMARFQSGAPPTMTSGSSNRPWRARGMRRTWRLLSITFCQGWPRASLRRRWWTWAIFRCFYFFCKKTNYKWE